MKKVKVFVKDKTLLELAEDASKGDLIDLKELVEVDASYLETIIDEGKDKVYEQKLNQFKKTLDLENQAKLDRLNIEIENLKKDNLNNLALKEKEVEKVYNEKIASLKNEINIVNSNKKNELDALSYEKQNEINKLNQQIELTKKDNEKALLNKEQELLKQYNDKISKLTEEIEILKANKKSEIDSLNIQNNASIEKIKNEDSLKYSKLEQEYNNLKNQMNTLIENKTLELNAKFNSELSNKETTYQLSLAKKESEIEQLKLTFENEKNKCLNYQKEQFNKELKEKDDKINNLQRAKSSLNVKQTGEDLESWCDNEVNSYMQNGLLNCTWIKDNKVVKDEDEVKGSKADYIFKIYANNQHDEKDLLTSVCLDMKDENPDSVNKKSNADYYKQLDKNREKKNCKYSVLVSNLEIDKANSSPIFKVREYENMYVVRPAYLMVFLNMITSLTTRFAELILSKKQEELQLKSKFDLINEFDNIKNTYLDKPIELLEKSISAINTNSDSIKKACRNIDEQCDKITRSYINQITEKLNKFELRLQKDIIKKFDE